MSGFKFFDNTNLNIDDENLKENVDVPVESGLFARDFLRSHNLIKPDYDINTPMAYPDVNPPGYSEVVKSSSAAPNKTVAFTKPTAVTETSGEVFQRSSKDFIRMVFEKESTDNFKENMPMNSQIGSSKMVHEQLNETDVDNIDMEMTTCIVSHNTRTDKLQDATAAVPSSDCQVSVHQDVEMTSVEPVTTPQAHNAEISKPATSVADSSTDDMEMTCAVFHSNLGMAASGNISDISQSTTRTASMEVLCYNPKVSVTPSEICDANSPQDVTEEMEFTCFVPLSSNAAPSSQSESKTNQHRTKSTSPDLHLTDTSQITENVMRSNNDDMEFTCMVSQKDTQKISDGIEQSVSISEEQIEKSQLNSMPKLSFNSTHIDSAHESTPLLKNSDGDEVAKAAFSECGRSIDKSSTALVDSANDSVFRQEASISLSATISQATANKEIDHLETQGITVIQESALVPDTVDARSNLTDDSNQTKCTVSGTHEVVDEVMKESCPVEKAPLPAAGHENATPSAIHPENPLMSRGDAIPVELILEKAGLVLRKVFALLDF